MTFELISNSCSDSTVYLAVIGLATVYFLLALLTYLLLNKMGLGDALVEAALVVLALLFPLTLLAIAIIGIIYFIVKWISFPFIGATKLDLFNTEKRLSTEINKLKRSKSRRK